MTLEASGKKVFHNALLMNLAVEDFPGLRINKELIAHISLIHPGFVEYRTM